jgi:hypothetical protein
LKYRVFLAIPALALGACGIVPTMNLEAPSATESCVDTMRHAYPEAEFDVTKEESKADSLAETSVTVEATRTDSPPTALFTDRVAAICRYDHNALVDFHWTKGPFS